MRIQSLVFVDRYEVALGRVENHAPVSSPLFQRLEIQTDRQTDRHWARQNLFDDKEMKPCNYEAAVSSLARGPVV